MSSETRGVEAGKVQPQKRVYRILLVDDHPVLRRGLSELISHEPDLCVCGEADGAAAAMRALDESSPHLVVVDISLGDLDGIELIKQIKVCGPSVKVLVCSMHDETIYAERALRAGAMGYVNKHEAAEIVISAIRQVLGGTVYLSQRMADRILHRIREGRRNLDRSPIDRLTDREIEVFEMLGQGLSTREIASRLNLSVKTIDAHRQKIKLKLSVGGSNELVQHAVQWVLQRQARPAGPTNRSGNPPAGGRIDRPAVPGEGAHPSRAGRRGNPCRSHWISPDTLRSLRVAPIDHDVRCPSAGTFELRADARSRNRKAVTHLIHPVETLNMKAEMHVLDAPATIEPKSEAVGLRELVAHLRQCRTQLRQEWARRIIGARLLSAMNEVELFAEATSVYDNYVEALATGTLAALQAYSRNLSERIIPRGVQTDEVVGIVLLLRDVLARSLFSRYHADFDELNRILDVYEPAANRIAITVAVGFVQERERTIREQQRAIRELSTPILQVRERLLILPIIGVIDPQRAQQLMDQLLHGIRINRARVVVIDITGVAAMDSDIANSLVLMVEASRLLGAVVIVTGLSPQIARTLVNMGVDLSTMNTAGDLQGGIEEAEALLAAGADAMDQPREAE